MNLLELYEAWPVGDESCQNARALLLQTHWFVINAEFDPRTGDALPQALSAFLAKVAEPAAGGATRDRLWRITEHSRASVERLFRALNESPRREQALLPIHAVRELDANSFIKLSNRPGRNIREKLAGKPYLQAVRRFQSVNLPENRLLKAFVIRLAELLELRRDCLNEAEDDLLPKIQSWLRSDEAQNIARWDNLPPNNTLLSHRDYRRVWDAWRWLQALDDDVTRDLSQLEARNKTMRLWKKYAQMWIDGGHRFADIPILFDYEKFEIRPWFSTVAVKQAPRKINRNFSTKEISSPVCVDLTILRPRYATATAAQSLPDAFLWQQWKNKDEAVDIELFNSDAAYIHPEAPSISSSDIFFTKNSTSEHFDRAARAFASKLRSIFKHDTLIWLAPDFLNDFELEIIRRNLNARFPNADPLPRSVAAAFERVDYSKIKDGFPIVVIDTIDGVTCVIKLLAKFDQELKKHLPETYGFYWERHPPIIIARTAKENAYDITTVDDKGQWRSAIRPVKPEFIDSSSLKSDPRIGQFAFALNLIESPVSGGIRLHDLQQRAGDIPLWRDQIPELSIKVMKDGRPQRFHLVSRGTPVKPIRGRPVIIDIDEDFTLPAGRQFYLFPLFLGESADDLGFSARLDSAAFPLKENVVCKLHLTFEYGADDPYKLVFTPLGKSFPPIRATWRRTEEVIITDAPSPEYPSPITWAGLENWTDVQGNQINLLEWLIDSLYRLHKLMPTRSAIIISSSWKQKTDINNEMYWFAFAKSENGEKCYCNTKNVTVFLGDDPNDIFPSGTELFCDIRTTKNGVSAFDISAEKDIQISFESKQRIISFRERSLQNRMSLIWGDARSLDNPECPAQFRKDFRELNAIFLENLPNEIIVKKMMFLLACMHKDTTDECVQWITEQVKNGSVRDPRAVGFALGDVSEQWQKDAMSKLVTHLSSDSLRVFAYAIWREQHFVEKFNSAELQSILKSLTAMLGEIRQCPPRRDEKDKKTVGNWVRATTEPLELLLGLLRTRASSDSEIKMLLQPHQKITKELAKRVEHVSEIVAKSNVTLFSRVQINIQKPEGDRTPNLLYALRLYLTGDDGANAIHITSVSDSHDD
jgi:hypothetical protein